jgi:hypothetical protein
MPAPKGHKPYTGCEKGSRPARYSKTDIERYADEFKNWLKEPTHVWFKDFCLDNDIDPDLMSEWAKDNEKFNGVYKMARHRQESRLVNGGLTNDLNSSIVKFVLANHHGYAEKAQIAGDSANPLQFLLEKTDGSSKHLVGDGSD